MPAPARGAAEKTDSSYGQIKKVGDIGAVNAKRKVIASSI